MGWQVDMQSDVISLSLFIPDAEEYQPPIWKSYCEYQRCKKLLRVFNGLPPCSAHEPSHKQHSCPIARLLFIEERVISVRLCQALSERD